MNFTNLSNLSSLSVQGNKSNIVAGTSRYILLDRFLTDVAAGSVNGTSAEPTGGTRKVTDTGSKLSISSGLLTLAGGAGDGDPIMWYPIQTRKSGLLLLGDLTMSATNAFSYVLGFGTNDSSSWTEAGFGFTNASAIKPVAGNALRSSVGEYSATSYKLAIAIRSSGAHFLIKGGSFTNWTLLWSDTNGNSANLYPVVDGGLAVFTEDNLRIPTSLWLPQPIAYDTFTRSNGALGSTESLGPDSQTLTPKVWTGSTWSISTNAAINTPTLGDDLVTNGGFDSDTTGWTATNATLASVAGGQSGNCLEVTNTAASKCYAYQAITTTIGKWYKIYGYYKNGTASSTLKAGTSAGGSQNYGKSLSTATWSARYAEFLATATTTYISCVCESTTAGDTSLFDGISINEVSETSEVFSTIPSNTSNIIIDIVPGTYTETSGGIVLNLDSTTNPQNFVIAYVSTVGTATAKMIKCVGGTYTSIISATVTATGGATLRVIKDGTSYSLYYNNAQVGSTSTISDAGIVDNTTHGLLSTDSGNTLDNFTIFDRGTSGCYNGLDQF